MDDIELVGLTVFLISENQPYLKKGDVIKRFSYIM